MDKVLKQMMAVGAACGVLLVVTPSSAGVDEALCAGGSECTVTLANGQIALSGQVIAKEQVLSWNQGGSGSKSDVGLGVVSTVLRPQCCLVYPVCSVLLPSSTMINPTSTTLMSQALPSSPLSRSGTMCRPIRS